MTRPPRANRSAAASDPVQHRPNRWAVAVVLGISLLAIAVRTIQLDRGELWFDEAYAGLVAMQPFNAIVGELARDSSPPLFYLLLRAWSLAVGFNPRISSVRRLYTFSWHPTHGS